MSDKIRVKAVYKGDEGKLTKLRTYHLELSQQGSTIVAHPYLAISSNKIEYNSLDAFFSDWDNVCKTK